MNTGVCAAGEFRCSGDVLETCSVDRTGFTTVATCQAGLCDAAGKQCDNCKPGEGTCSGSAGGRICSADGQKLEDVTCTGDTPFCVASGKEAACVACRTSVDCSISSNPCQLSVCSAEGSCGSVAVAADTACSASGGKCDGAGNCRECNAGDKRCSGLQPQSCGTDGRWVTASACASPAPLCLGGDCIQCVAASDCPASANSCTQAVCSSGTCGYVATAQGTSCAGGTCNGAGQCNACSPGTKVCNGNQVLSCNGNGQYDPPSNCGGSTPYCENSTGSCVQCTSVAQCTAPTNPCLQAACTGNACGVSARPDGTVCAVGNDAGTCQAGACTLCAAGQTRCQPGTNIPQSCSAGLWVGSAACASPTALCNAGACMECITAANCPSSTNACLQAVCSSGVCGFSPKAQGTTCSGGTCNGTGQCNACTPNSSVCNGNQILTCGSNGQYTAPTTCSSPTPYCDGATTSCVQCTSAAHCTAPTNACLQATCSGGSCGVSVRADGTACSVSGDSGTCSAGNCAVCTNGATRCKPGVTTTPQVCSGGQWADQVMCAGGMSCRNGTCVTTCYSARFGTGGAAIALASSGVSVGKDTTVEFWVNDVAPGANQFTQVLGQRNPESGVWWSIRRSSTRLSFELSNGSGYCDWEIPVYAANQWNHVAWVFAGQNLPQVFINGNPVSLVVGGSCSLSGGAITSAYSFSMGGYQAQSGRAVNGLIRGVRISSTARYSTAFTPAKTYLLDASTTALYRLDEGQGVMASDSAPVARNATLNVESWSLDCP